MSKLKKWELDQKYASARAPHDVDTAELQRGGR